MTLIDLLIQSLIQVHSDISGKDLVKLIRVCGCKKQKTNWLPLISTASTKQHFLEKILWAIDVKYKIYFLYYNQCTH